MRRLLVLVIALAGCGPSDHSTNHQPPSSMDGGTPSLTSIDITPATVSLTTTSGGAAAAQQFTATAHYSDGTTADVTSTIGWSLSDDHIGTIDKGAFTGSPTRGGVTTVSAGDNTVQGTATLTIKYIANRVSTDDGSTAPANSPSLFGGTDDPTLAPTLAYPNDGAVVPQNLGLLEVQWKKPTGAADLYEVSFSAPTLDFKLYTNAIQTAGGRLSLKPDEWISIAQTVAGGDVTVKVRAVATADPTKVGSSTTAKLHVGAQSVMGGIYYWSPVGAGSTGVIMRHSFGDTTGTASVFFAPTKPDNSQRCVGCHVINSAGDKMAVTYDGGNGPIAIASVPGLSMFLPEQTTPKWNFASFAPDGNRIVTAGQGIINIVDSSGGAKNGTVLQQLTTGMTGSYASHPDWSPDATKIVYVSVGKPNSTQDWSFTGGSIVVVSDQGNGMFGNPQTIVAAANGVDNYYPSFSPDSKWILFNRGSDSAAQGCYNDHSAEVWVVSADGKIGPIALGNANSTIATPTNSWPRWNPNIVHEASGDLMYLTFSSTRDYGIELVGVGAPQIWMAAFDPAKAMQGVDPSGAAFWMPYQDVKSHNHIAQWTATYIP